MLMVSSPPTQLQRGGPHIPPSVSLSPLAARIPVFSPSIWTHWPNPRTRMKQFCKYYTKITTENKPIQRISTFLCGSFVLKIYPTGRCTVRVNLSKFTWINSYCSMWLRYQFAMELESSVSACRPWCLVPMTKAKGNRRVTLLLYKHVYSTTTMGNMLISISNVNFNYTEAISKQCGDFRLTGLRRGWYFAFPRLFF